MQRLIALLLDSDKNREIMDGTIPITHMHAHLARTTVLLVFSSR